MSMLEYVNTIFQSDDIVELRCIKCKDKSVKKYWKLAKELHSLTGELQILNEQDYNIYIGVNPRIEMKKSGDSNVKIARFLFADFDNLQAVDAKGMLEEVSDRICQAGIEEQPDLNVFSGHGIHTYWKLPEPMNDLERWRKIQVGLIKRLDSDKQIKNPERIMRLTGFKNLKNQPTDCFILQKGEYYDIKFK